MVEDAWIYKKECYHQLSTERYTQLQNRFQNEKIDVPHLRR